MGREVRKVPADWQHPKNDHGGYLPLLSSGYAGALVEWHEGLDLWCRGLRDNYKGGTEPHNERPDVWGYVAYTGRSPNVEDYMPNWTPQQATHFMMYETTSEGTPISPAFATREELARWLADNGASAFGATKATYEQWLNIARGSYAPSLVVQDGKMMSGVEAATKTSEE